MRIALCSFGTFGARTGAGELDSDYLDRRTGGGCRDATLFTSRMANISEGGAPEQIRAI